MYGFHGGPARYQGLLAAWLHAAAHADLLMCHPGLACGKADGIAEARAAEFQVISGTEFDMLLEKTQVHMLPMSRILAQAPALDSRTQ